MCNCKTLLSMFPIKLNQIRMLPHVIKCKFSIILLTLLHYYTLYSIQLSHPEYMLSFHGTYLSNIFVYGELLVEECLWSVYIYNNITCLYFIIYRVICDSCHTILSAGLICFPIYRKTYCRSIQEFELHWPYLVSDHEPCDTPPKTIKTT